MAWNDAVVVNGGLELLNQTGGKFYLDYAAGGSETVDAKALMAQTALKAQKQAFSIVGVQDVAQGKKLNILITSQGLASGYDMRQIGIWAHVDDGPARLFAIIQDSRGVSVPSQTEMPDFAMNFYAVIKYSGAAEFQLSVDPEALVSQKDMRAAIAEVDEAKQDKLTGTAGQVVGFDADGNAVPESADSLKGPPGTDGKSAYQYAVDGGYTGTEAEFQALLGSGPWLPRNGSNQAEVTVNSLNIYNQQGIVFEYPMAENWIIVKGDGLVLAHDTINGEPVRLMGISQPTHDTDAANKQYVDDLVGDIASLLDEINGEMV